MQTMQEDNFRTNRNRAQEINGFITLEQFLLRQEEERQRSIVKPQERPSTSNDLGNGEPSTTVEYDEEERRSRPEMNNFNRGNGRGRGGIFFFLIKRI